MLCLLSVLNGEVATIAAPLMRSSPHRSKLFTAEETLYRPSLFVSFQTK